VTDKNDVLLAQQGDQQAMTRLYNGSIEKVETMLLRWADDYNDAEDIAQEAMLKAFKSIDKFKGNSKFHTWVWRIAKNEAVNHHIKWSQRRPPRQDVDYNDAHLTNMETPEQIAEESDLESRIMSVLDNAPDDVRIMFIESILSSDFSHDKIAKRLNIPKGTVKSRLFSIREEINEEIGYE